MQKKLAKNFEVLKPNDFLQDFILEVGRAKRRAWVQTMYMRPGKVTTQVLTILKTAAAQGINTKVHLDWYDLLTQKAHFTLQDQANKSVLISDLQSVGAKILFTNPPNLIEKILPYKGRNHMKMTIVDDVAYLGGTNFGDEDFNCLDFMVKITDKAIVETIVNQFIEVDKNQLLEDKKTYVNNDTTILVDAGKSGRSIILDNAINIIKQAERSILHVSQFVPDGKFLRALHSMYKRKIKVEVITTTKNQSNKVFALVHKLNQLEMSIRNWQIPVTFYRFNVHAKLTIVDETIALFGSHNMSEKGVIMGTAEITIQSKNKALLRDLTAFVKL